MANNIDISVDGLGEITIENKTLGRNENDTLYDYSDGYTLDLLANELETFSSFLEWKSSNNIDVNNTTGLDTTATILDTDVNFDYRTYIKGETEAGTVDDLLVVFTFDKSGSMDDNNLTETKNAINNFIDQAANDSETNMYYTIVEYADDAYMRSNDFVEAKSSSLRAQTGTDGATGTGTDFNAAMTTVLQAFYDTSMDLTSFSKSIIHTSDGTSVNFDETADVTINSITKSYSQHAKDNNLNHIYSLVIYNTDDSDGMKNISRMIHSDEDIKPNDPNSGYYRTGIDGSNIDNVYTEILNTIKKVYVYQTFSDRDDSSFTNITLPNTSTQLCTIMDQSTLETEYPDLDISTCDIITEITNIESNYTASDINITPGTNVVYDDTINEITAQTIFDSEYYITADFEHDGYTLTTYSTPTSGGSVDVDYNPHNLSGNLYGYYNSGELVNIEAIVNQGYLFDKWIRVVSGTSTTKQLTMDKSKEAEALFNVNEHTLEVNIYPDESFGTYTVDPKEEDMTYETDIHITVKGIEGTNGDFDRIEYNDGLSNVSINDLTIDFDITGDAVIDYHFDEILYMIDIEIVGEGDVNVNPNPGDLTSPSYGYYNYGTNVELQAINNTEGWEFSHWELDIDSTDQYESFDIKQDMNVRAVFEANEYKLLAESDGTGEILLEEIDVYNPQGNVQSNYINRNYLKNDVIDLSYVSNDDCWYFNEWTNDLSGTASTERITIDSNKYVVADFKIYHYSILTDTEGNGSVKLNPSESNYNCGDVVEIEGIPDEGYEFNHWEGHLNSTNSIESFPIYEDKSITGVFTKKEYTLNVDIVGNGSVSIEPNKSTYSHGEEVILKATEQDSWNFTSYTYENESPVEVDTDREIRVTMNKDRNITALFEQDNYNLTIDIVGRGKVNVTPKQDTYSEGDLIELEAVADDNWIFYDWSSKPSVDLVGSIISFNITEDTHITAYFKSSIDTAVNYELINNRYKGIVESYKFNKQNHQTELNIDKIENYYESINSLIENINNNLDEYSVLKRRLLSLQDKIKRLYNKGDK